MTALVPFCFLLGTSDDEYCQLCAPGSGPATCPHFGQCAYSNRQLAFLFATLSTSSRTSAQRLPRYDLIMATNAHHSIFDYRRALSLAGAFVMVGGDLVQTLQVFLPAPFLSRIGNMEMGSSLAKTNHKDLVFLRDLLEAGEVVPVIDRRYAKRRC